MAALLPALTVTLTVLIGSTAITPAAASPYSRCPLPTALERCTCSEDSSDRPTVTVSAPDDDIEACITSLSASGHTTLLNLTVKNYPDLKLTDNLFRDVLVKILYFDYNIVTELTDDFLGNSRNFTERIDFNYGTLEAEFPSLRADVLITLWFYGVSMNGNLHIRKNAFSGTPALEYLRIESLSSTTGVLTVHRRAMEGLTKLRWVLLYRSSLHLRWGALHFTAPGLEYLGLGRPGATIEASTGSIAGIPAGANVKIYGLVNGGWQPSKFFNILRGGAFFNQSDTIDCGCDLAWIRYSSFIDQVDVDCWVDGGSTIDLSLVDLSHCSFFKDPSMDKSEL